MIIKLDGCDSFFSWTNKTEAMEACFLVVEYDYIVFIMRIIIYVYSVYWIKSMKKHENVFSIKIKKCKSIHVYDWWYIHVQLIYMHMWIKAVYKPDIAILIDLQ